MNTMKTLYAAAVALLALSPVLANASGYASTGSVSDGSNTNQFPIASSVGSVNSAARADAQKFADRNAPGAKVVTYYDPSADANAPRFPHAVTFDGGNAAAARADVARYDAAAKGHVAGARVITQYDPSAGDNGDRFATSVVID
jgi:hypothetical protein